MFKRAISAALTLCMLALVFTASAAAAVTATCSDGKTVKYTLSGLEANTAYVLRIADSEKLVFMENITSNSEGKVDKSVIINDLTNGKSYNIYVDSWEGTTILSGSFTVTSSSGGGDNGGGSGHVGGGGGGGGGTTTTPTTTEKAIINGKSSDISLNTDGSVTLTAAQVTSHGGSFVLGIPLSGGSENTTVAMKDGVIFPFSSYSGGNVYALVTSAGTYSAIDNAKSFGDTAGHWAADNIAFVAARELFSGVGNNNFSPNTSMTRSMFATVLARLDGADTSSYRSSRFGDVPSGQWYTGGIEWAAENGIVSGTGSGQFSPDSNITREQMAVMLNRYIAYKGFTLPGESDASDFNDDAQISLWAKDAVSGIQKAGIITGKPGGIFDPHGIATRGEVSTVFTRFIEALVA